MKTASRCFLILSLVLWGLTLLSRAGFQSFPTADFALGRSDPHASFYCPNSVAVDPVSNKVFVCDTRSHRVLRFTTAANLASQAVPEAVFGQPDLLSSNTGFSAAAMNLPAGIVLDTAGRLWVADGGNRGVLPDPRSRSLINHPRPAAIAE